ncbi:hypothetical protein ACWY4P_53775 (plasmid) [Streptomyces sp. LZ34]
MPENGTSNGRFPGPSYDRLVTVAAALIAAKLMDGGPQDALAFVTIAQYLLPPSGDGRGPGQPAI